MLKMYPGAIEAAVKAFRDHSARYERGASFDVLDWRRKNDITYWVRMVFDHERDDTRAVYITGDMGDAVVYPTCRASLPEMARCFTIREDDGSIWINEMYFIEKIRASSDLYDWGLEEFEEDLREEFVRRYGEDEDQEELDAFFAEYCESCFPDVVVENGVHIQDRFAKEALESIFPDYNEWIWDCGSRINSRVVFWLVAMRLAYEQIGKTEEDKNCDKGEQGSSEPSHVDREHDRKGSKQPAT